MDDGEVKEGGDDRKKGHRKRKARERGIERKGRKCEMLCHKE